MRGRVLVGAAVVVAVAACRQIVGIGDGPPGAGAGAAQACGFTWASASCAACTQSSCCAQATACRGDQVCSVGYECMAQCADGDELCRGHCVTQGDDTMAALGACEATHCSTECGLTCGGWGLVAGSLLHDLSSSQACRSCYESTAVCASVAACIQDPRCLAYDLCFNSCLPYDGLCTNNCGQSPLPDGGTDAGGGPGLMTTFQSTCVGPCNIGTDWSCVGKVPWPPPSSTTITISVRANMTDFNYGTPLAGGTVRACDGNDRPCAHPRAMGTTDSMGLTTLQVPIQAGFQGGFQGYFDFRASGYLPQLLFVYPYLWESSAPAPAPAPVGAGMILLTDVPGYYMAVGTTYDQSLGTLFGTPVDCDGWWAPGVSFNGYPLGSQAAPFYAMDRAPTNTLDATVVQGNLVGGGWGNVSPGLVTINAVAGGKKVASAEVVVRAAALTIVNFAPIPAP